MKKKRNFEKVLSILSCLLFTNSAGLTSKAMDDEETMSLILNHSQQFSEKSAQTKEMIQDEQDFKTAGEWQAYFEGYLGNKEVYNKYQKQAKSPNLLRKIFSDSKQNKANVDAWKKGNKALNESKINAPLPSTFLKNENLKNLEKNIVEQMHDIKLTKNYQRKEIKKQKIEKEKENNQPIDQQQIKVMTRMLQEQRKINEQNKPTNEAFNTVMSNDSEYRNVNSDKKSSIKNNEQSLKELNKQLIDKLGISANANKDNVQKHIFNREQEKLNREQEKLNREREQKLMKKLKNKNLSVDKQIEIRQKLASLSNVDAKFNEARPNNLTTNFENGTINKNSKLNLTLLEQAKKHYIISTASLAVSLYLFDGLADYFKKSHLENTRNETARLNAETAKQLISMQQNLDDEY